MAGHSKWATTHRQKADEDAKPAAIFTKKANQNSNAPPGGTYTTKNSS